IIKLHGRSTRPNAGLAARDLYPVPAELSYNETVEVLVVSADIAAPYPITSSAKPDCMLTAAGNFRPSVGFSLQYPIGSAKTCRRKLTLRERTMEIIRREFLRLSSLAVTVPSIANIVLAQAQAGPKLTQILRDDLEGQSQVVQETVV